MEPLPSQVFLAAVEASEPQSFIPASASSLLRTLQRSSENLQPLAAGLSSLDDNVLLSGIPRQSVIGIASSSGTSQSSLGRIFALQLVCNLLAQDADAKAMVLDTTGSFALQTLLDLAKGAAVDECRRDYRETGRSFNDRLVETVALDVLERVAITRVFDVEGVWDVIGEMRAGAGDNNTPQSFEDDEEVSEYEGDYAAAEVQEDLAVLSIDVDQERRERAAREHTLPIVAAPRSPELQSSRFAGPSAHTQHQTGDSREVELEKTMPSPLLPPITPKRLEAERWIPPSAQPPSSHLDVAESSSLSSLPSSSPLSELPSWVDGSPILLRRDMAEDENSEEMTPERASSGSSSSSLRSLLIVTPTASQERRRVRDEEEGEVDNGGEDDIVEKQQGEESPSKRCTQPQSKHPQPGSSQPIVAPTSPCLRPPSPSSVEAGDENGTAIEPAALPVSSLLPPSHPSSPPQPLPKRLSDCPRRSHPPPQRSTSILLIDALPPLITKLFADLDRQDAHKELASLSHLLTSLSRSKAPITVVLLNSLTEGKPGEPTSSVFADMKETPSLAAVYDGMVDMSLMCYQLPARTKDDGLLCGGGGGRSEGGAEIKMVNVLEVLRDDTMDLERWEGVKSDSKPGGRTNREGLWGAFDVKRDGNGVGTVFRDVDWKKQELPKYKDAGFGRRP